MGRRTATTVLAGASALLMALAGCSGERDVGSGGGPQNCDGSEQAAREIEQVWQEGADALGLRELAPPDQRVCRVDTARFATEEPFRIGFASQGATNSWALEYDFALRDAAEQQGAEILYASANGNAATQVNNIQDLLAQDPDALIVTPMSAAIQGQLRQAAQQDVPVVVCTGRLEDSSSVVSTVGRSYDLQGTLFAEWIAQQIDGRGQVAMLSGIAGVPTAEYQHEAAMRVFERYRDIEVVTREFTNWSPTEARRVAETLLTRFPDLDAIWSDSGISSTGVIQAYQAANRPIPPVTGDSSNAFLRAAQDVEVDFALSAYPPEQSRTCLDTALRILRGEPVNSIIEMPSAVYTRAQADEYYREDCSDNLWVPSELTDRQLAELELC